MSGYFRLRSAAAGFYFDAIRASFTAWGQALTRAGKIPPHRPARPRPAAVGIATLAPGSVPHAGQAGLCGHARRENEAQGRAHSKPDLKGPASMRVSGRVSPFGDYSPTAVFYRFTYAKRAGAL